MNVKICPICQKKFTAGKGNIKYCSEACREAGKAAARKQWEARTQYTEKQREAATKRREEDRQKQAKLTRERQRQHDLEHRERLQRMREDLERRAEAGDYAALEQLARERGDMLQFWHWRKMREIEYAESNGRYSTFTVNEISVYDDDFEQKVLRSIEALGACIQKCNGLGAKLDKTQ